MMISRRELMYVFAACASLSISSELCLLSSARKEPTVTYKQNVIDLFGASLLAYWTEGEAAGTLIRDSSGNGCDGTCSFVNLAMPGIGDGGYALSQEGIGQVNVFSPALQAQYPLARGIVGWIKDDDWTDPSGRWYISFANADKTELIGVLRGTVANRLTFMHRVGTSVKKINYPASDPGWILVAMGWDDETHELKGFVGNQQVGMLPGIGDFGQLAFASLGSRYGGLGAKGSHAHWMLLDHCPVVEELTELLVVEYTEPTAMESPILVIGTEQVIASNPPLWYGRVGKAKIAGGLTLLTYMENTNHDQGPGIIHLRETTDESAWSDQDKHLDGSPFANFPTSFPSTSEADMIKMPDGSIVVYHWHPNDLPLPMQHQSRSLDGQTFPPFVPSVIEDTPNPLLSAFCESHFTVGNRVYLAGRELLGLNGSTVRRSWYKTDDNGESYQFIAPITQWGGEGTEVGITRISDDLCIGILRSWDEKRTFRTYGYGTPGLLGTSWTTPEDITALIPAIIRPRVYTLAQLAGEPDWWLDPNLVLQGCVKQVQSASTHKRRNVIFRSWDSGVNWSAPGYFDVGFPDGGYNSLLQYDDLYKLTAYRGSQDTSDVINYAFQLRV